MGFKDAVIILAFIFVLFRFLKPLGLLLGESSSLLKGPAGALLAITLLFYVIDAFLDKSSKIGGGYFPTAAVQSISGIAQTSIAAGPRRYKSERYNIKVPANPPTSPSFSFRRR